MSYLNIRFIAEIAETKLCKNFSRKEGSFVNINRVQHLMNLSEGTYICTQGEENIKSSDSIVRI